MNQWKQNKLRHIMKKRREEQEMIKKLDTGGIFKALDEKYKRKIEPDQLPF